MASIGQGVLGAQDGVSETLRVKFGLRRCAGIGPVALYRSRELTDATLADVQALQALGITAVLDLRKQAEREVAPEPDSVRRTFEVRTCPVDLQDDEHRTRATMAPQIKQAYGHPGERMTALYRIMANHADTVRSLVRHASKATAPILMHCANGKDRVGVVCASVQYSRGVPSSAILADYLETNACNEHINRRDLRRYAGIVQPDELEVLAAMFEARAEYLSAFFSTIEKRYGSFDAWMAG